MNSMDSACARPCGSDSEMDINKAAQKNKTDIALEIMELSRRTLLLHLRFMDVALCSLDLKEYRGSFAVDGQSIWFDPEHVIRVYRDGKNIPARMYLHMVFHCVFRHIPDEAPLDRKLWDLACDIAAENVIDAMNLGSICQETGALRSRWLDQLRTRAGIITAEKLYRFFLNEKLPESEIDELEECFRTDDHSRWYRDSGARSVIKTYSAGDSYIDEEDKDGELAFGSGESEEGGVKDKKEKWRDISEMMMMELESFAKKQGDTAGDMLQNLRESNREKYDYASFLRKFSVMGEEMTVNDEDFDYIFYTYGLKLYGKMPLVEPLEYKESRRIKDFVIAIDTSGSVSGELVQKFIDKTYNILQQEDSFFRKVNLHIVQCDTEIHEHVKVTSKLEMERYLKEMVLKGFGGTDFRPVFEYVDRLIKEGEFTDFKGLIYFTDGYGTYPSKPPDYKTAFVFVDDEYNNYNVPAWAIKLILQSHEL